MLSEEEKELIRLRETCRFEVREKLQNEADKKIGWGKVIYFFNSKLGLWILSAVFLSGGVVAYDDYKEKKEDKKSRTELVEKLDLEISYKFNRVIYFIDELSDKKGENSQILVTASIDDVREIALGLDKSSGKKGDFLNGDFQNWSLLALMVELRRQLGKSGIKDNELDQVITHMTDLPAFFEGKNIDYANIPAIKKLIRENLILSRWQNQGFAL